MRRTGVRLYRPALAVLLAVLLGWASVADAGGRGKGRGGPGFHKGRGGGAQARWHGPRGGRFRGHHPGFRRHHGFRHRGFRHHGFHGKAFIGVGPLFLWGPRHIYTPPPVVVPPPVYVQPAPAGYWYYCASAGAYYPYVAACPESWILVPPR